MSDSQFAGISPNLFGSLWENSGLRYTLPGVPYIVYAPNNPDLLEKKWGPLTKTIFRLSLPQFAFRDDPVNMTAPTMLGLFLRNPHPRQYDEWPNLGEATSFLLNHVFWHELYCEAGYEQTAPSYSGVRRFGIRALIAIDEAFTKKYGRGLYAVGQNPMRPDEASRKIEDLKRNFGLDL